jgi:hypothetical protein
LTRRANQRHYFIIAQFAKRPWPCPEAVGLFDGEDLKGNQGSADWLRLFQLMSLEFAVAEGFAELRMCPRATAAFAEIKELGREPINLPADGSPAFAMPR